MRTLCINRTSFSAVIITLECLPAVCASGGHVPYNPAFGAPTCAVCEKKFKFVTKEKMSTVRFQPWTSGLTARYADSMGVWHGLCRNVGEVCTTSWQAPWTAKYSG